MDYILSGNPKDVAKVIQENRIRVQRGVIKFTPLADVESAPEEPEADTKEAVEDDVKDVVEDDVKTEPEADTKEAVEDDVKTAKTTNRSKKSE
ncbi:MAG: hypothetical protein HUK14_06060 [Muribaculaceae bacterium]|nr:hypothetical protein [Muribaculaceae bacterium]